MFNVMCYVLYWLRAVTAIISGAPKQAKLSNIEILELVDMNRCP
jgi:hypothetical protein